MFPEPTNFAIFDSFVRGRKLAGWWSVAPSCEPDQQPSNISEQIGRAAGAQRSSAPRNKLPHRGAMGAPGNVAAINLMQDTFLFVSMV